MADTELTEFQTRTQSRVRQVLARHNRTVESQEVFRGKVPFYSKDPVVAVKMLGGGVEVWLFDDDVSYSFRGHSRIFENSDFGSPDELADAFLSALEASLSEA